MLKKTAILLGALLITACYAKDYNEPGVKNLPKYSTDRTYSASFDRVWEALLNVTRDAPVFSLRKEEGAMITDWIVSKSDRLFSGYADAHVPYKIRYRFFIDVIPDGSSTAVSIENEEQYYTDSVTTGGDFSGTLFKWENTESSTVKEKRLLDAIEDFISKRSR